MSNITHVVIHTAAAARDGKAVDVSANAIRDYHMNHQGWADIGYHWVVRMSGKVEKGRDESQGGAHTAGFNTQSIGVCFSGHGDLMDLLPAQKAAGAELVADILRRHGLVEEFLKNPKRVIGHREINDLIEAGVAGTAKKTYKTCPGTKVDCSAFRRLVLAEFVKPKERAA